MRDISKVVEDNLSKKVRKGYLCIGGAGSVSLEEEFGLRKDDIFTVGSTTNKFYGGFNGSARGADYYIPTGVYMKMISQALSPVEAIEAMTAGKIVVDSTGAVVSCVKPNEEYSIKAATKPSDIIERIEDIGEKYLVVRNTSRRYILVSTKSCLSKSGDYTQDFLDREYNVVGSMAEGIKCDTIS